MRQNEEQIADIKVTILLLNGVIGLKHKLLTVNQFELFCKNLFGRSFFHLMSSEMEKNAISVYSHIPSLFFIPNVSLLNVYLPIGQDYLIIIVVIIYIQKNSMYDITGLWKGIIQDN